MKNDYLLNSFKEYIEIENNSENEVILDSCDSFTPTITLPLVMFIRSNDKDVNQHENPRVNDYLRNVMKVKKPHVNAFRPFSWINDEDNNSEEIISLIFYIMNPEGILKDNLNAIFQDLLDNIYERSNFDMGFVMAQYFPELDENEYAFIDNSGSYDFESSKDFIDFIRSNEKLNEVINIVTLKLNGNIMFISGNLGVEFSKQDVISRNLSENYLEGNLVSFRF